MRLPTRLAYLLVSSVAAPLLWGTPEEVARTIVVANVIDPDSVALARHYLEARGIPEANLCTLELPIEETITREVFEAEVKAPLLTWLRESGWTTGVAQMPTSHRMAYLVLMRGVPLRIERAAIDPSAEELRKIHATATRLTGRPESPAHAALARRLKNDRASVDSELSVLAMPESPRAGIVVNPLFAQESPAEADLKRVVRVARLDAAEPATVRRMIYGALEAEAKGLRGRAYIDVARKYPEGDAWLRRSTAVLRLAGFPVDVEATAQTLPATVRFDAPAIYLGWYAHYLNGPFQARELDFPPGAIAVHIHSYSAETLRNTGGRWCGALLHRGVTATLGHVYEPYLSFTHHLDIFTEGLLAGESFGQAAYRATLALSWQGVVLGDPLYRPFAVDLDAQVANLSEADTWTEYAVLRKMNALRYETGGSDAAALAFGQEAMKTEARGPALALEVARLLEKAGDREAAAKALLAGDRGRAFTANTWTLTLETAGKLEELGQPEAAADLIARLLGAEHLRKPHRTLALERGISAAQRSGHQRRFERWSTQLTRLKAQSPEQE